MHAEACCHDVFAMYRRVMQENEGKLLLCNSSQFGEKHMTVAHMASI